MAAASFRVDSPNTIVKMLLLTFRDLNIDIVATGSTADMKNPNCSDSRYSNGTPVYGEYCQNIKLNVTPAMIVEKTAYALMVKNCLKNIDVWQLNPA